MILAFAWAWIVVAGMFLILAYTKAIDERDQLRQDLNEAQDYILKLSTYPPLTLPPLSPEEEALKNEIMAVLFPKDAEYDPTPDPTIQKRGAE